MYCDQDAHLSFQCGWDSFILQPFLNYSSTADVYACKCGDFHLLLIYPFHFDEGCLEWREIAFIIYEFKKSSIFEGKHSNMLS